MATNHHVSKKEKSVRFWRRFFAFFAFLAIVGVSFSAMAKLYFVNDNQIASIFIKDEYVDGMFEDVYQYSSDLCLECGLTDDVIDDVLTRESIKEILNVYANGTFGSKVAYNASSYLDSIETLQNEICENIISTIKENKTTYDGKLKSGATTLASDICEYITELVEFDYGDSLRSVTNYGESVSNVLLVISAIFLVLFVVATCSIGEHKYRKLRDVSHAFMAAGIFHFIIVLAIGYVKLTKDLVLYPSYLSDALMSFLNVGQFIIGAVGGGLIVIFLIIATNIWGMKHSLKA